MITLYQFEISPFCDKIRRVLHWKGQPYQVREIPLAQTFTRLRKINPVGKLPCIEHEGRLIADSTDIAHYLEERFPDPPLVPSDPLERGLCHMLEDWADESLYFYEMRLRFTFPHNARRWLPALTAHDGAFIRRLAPRVIPRLMRGALARQGLGLKPRAAILADVERHLAAAADRLEGRDWLVGEALCLADLSVFAQFFCIRGTEEGAKMIEARPGVSAWMQRVDRATSAPA